MEARRKRRCNFWERCDVPYCFCPALSYKHTHCPCEQCLGVAVCRSTEYRHWLAAKSEADDLLAHAGASPVDPQAQSTASTSDRVQIRVDSPTHDGDGNLGERLQVSSTQARNDSDEDLGDPLLISPTRGDDENRSQQQLLTLPSGQLHPLAEVTHTATGDIIWSITEAMQLVEEMDASQRNFMQILSYGKHLYERGRQADGRGCELQDSSEWPQSWQGALKLLQEAGYVPPKTLYVCLNSSHYCSWDVLPTASDLCRHCDQPGSIKYYYLPLRDKVC